MIRTTLSRQVRGDIEKLLGLIRSAAGFDVPITLIARIALGLLLEAPLFAEELARVPASEVEDWLIAKAVTHHRLDTNQTWLPFDSPDRDGGEVAVELTPAQEERITELRGINPAVTPEVALRAAFRLWVGCKDTDEIDKPSIAEDLGWMKRRTDEDGQPIEWNDVEHYLLDWWDRKRQMSPGLIRSLNKVHRWRRWVRQKENLLGADGFLWSSLRVRAAQIKKDPEDLRRIPVWFSRLEEKKKAILAGGRPFDLTSLVHIRKLQFELNEVLREVYGLPELVPEIDLGLPLQEKRRRRKEGQ